jgi:FkbM family methyltransferase
MRRIVRPGDVVFDVGAHIGLHNVMFSAAVGPAGRLHAFEANPRKIHALAATLGRLPNATLHPFGLSDHSGEAVLFVPESSNGKSGRLDGGACRRGPAYVVSFADARRSHRKR